MYATWNWTIFNDEPFSVLLNELGIKFLAIWRFEIMIHKSLFENYFKQISKSL